MNKKITDLKKLDDIEGFNTLESYALIDIFCRFIEPRTSLEIGTWKGKTSCIICNNTTETFHYIEADSRNYYETRINIINHTNFNSNSIVGLKNTSICASLEQKYIRCFDFVHIDGEHSFSGVYNDLQICSEKLLENGIIILDDIFSATYPQITESLYRFLFENPEFKLLLVGVNKGIICFNKYYSYYSNFIINELLNEFKKYNIENIQVCKTTSIADCFTYGINFGKSGYRGDESPYDFLKRFDYVESIKRIDLKNN